MVITGIIRPPPDIRVVADRTAMFVAKNGRAFESRILNSAKGKTPKFAFLQTSSPFHAYYEDRIRHFEAGGGETADEPKKEEANDTKAKAPAADAAAAKSKTTKDNVTKQKASVMDPLARAILKQRSVIADHFKEERKKRRHAAADAKETVNEEAKEGQEQNDNDDAVIVGGSLPLPTPPAPLDTVRVVAPYNLTPTQIETIQLVAQFVAMDGKGGPFLPALVSREWSNPEFAFCQPRNIHFAYFSALVDAYRNILTEVTEAANSTTSTTTPEVYSVQTALNDAAYRTEYERELERRRQKQQENSNMEDGEIANAIDWHDFVVVETIDFPIEERVDVSLSMQPTKMASTTALTTTTTDLVVHGSTVETDMDESSDEDDADSNIRVVPSYKPKVVGTFDPSTARAVDPLTGKSVSVADMPEHMRIQLLDPKWAEERKKFQDKQKDSNLVGGDAVVANFARLAATTSTAPGYPSLTPGAPSTTRPPTVAPVGPALATQQKRPGPPTREDQPSPKRLRTALLQSQSQHKVTVAPPLVVRAPPVVPTAIPTPTIDPVAADPTENAEPAAGASDPAPEGEAEEKILVSAEEFIATLEEPVVELSIKIPNDITQQNWNFFGQTLVLEDVDVHSVVKDVKSLLSKKHLNGMPPNKIQLRVDGKFLNNNTSLAALNIGPKATLEVKTKQRGGRNLK